MAVTVAQKTFTKLDVSKVRARLLMKAPFFGSLGLRLKVELDEAIPTACTNGVEMRINPKFMARLSFTQQQGVWAHEVAHCALLHMFRTEGRDMRTWNRACDYAINPMLIAAGFELPGEVKDEAGKVIFTGPCLDQKYKGMNAERIYQLLKQEQVKNRKEQGDGGNGSGQGKSEDSGGGSDSGDGKTDSGAEGTDSGGPGNEQRNGGTPHSGNAPKGGNGQTEVGASVTGEFVKGIEGNADGAAETSAMNEQGWKIAVAQAAAVAKAAGSMPGGWVEDIKASREPKMDPWAVLEQFVAKTVATDISWTSPNRRMMAQGVYMPGAVKDNTGEMVMVFDTSGSFTAEMLKTSAENIIGICQTYAPERIHLVFCDTRVTHSVTYETSEYADMKFECKGRGGTRFQPAFDWIEQQGISPVCAIYFTDLEGPQPEEPGYPVLWAVPEASGATGWFGETVRIGVK